VVGAVRERVAVEHEERSPGHDARRYTIGPVHRLTLRTERREEMVDITAELAAAVAELGVAAGAVLVHIPHTPATVTVNEGYDPDVAADVVHDLSQRVPRDAGYAHAEGNSDSHIKAILVGCSQVIPVADGKPALGRWQRVFFCEFDGPRSREVWVSPLGAK
jgi:secondary thiamine-phosphate synthase enzyme